MTKPREDNAPHIRCKNAVCACVILTKGERNRGPSSCLTFCMSNVEETHRPGSIFDLYLASMEGTVPPTRNKGCKNKITEDDSSTETYSQNIFKKGVA